MIPATLIVALAALAVTGTPVPGSPSDILGVIILPAREADATLADNLSEVAMARVAAAGRKLVGTLELRRRAGASGERSVSGCLAEPACLGEIAVSLGATRMITGLVRSQGERRFLVNLTLTDVAASRVVARFFRRVEGGVEALVQAIQQGVDEVVGARRTPGLLRVQTEPRGARVSLDEAYLGATPLLSSDVDPGRHGLRIDLAGYHPWTSVIDVAPGAEVSLRLGPGQLSPRRRWAPYAAYGAAGAAVLSLSAGGVLGLMARGTPVGQTREEAQRDLQHRAAIGRIGTGLILTGAVTALASALIFHRHWHDIVGE